MKSLTVIMALLAPMLATADSIPSWEQTSGPVGGVVSKMLTINNEPIAALYSGGIYAYRANRWQQVGINHGLPENRAFDIVVDPTNANYIYSGMMIACAARSSDGGVNWEGLCDRMLATLDLDNFSTDTLVLDPTDPATLYIAGRGSDDTRYFLKSPDRGDTWEIVSTFAEGYFFNHLVALNNKLYLGLRSGGVLVSSDNGVTWTALNDGLSEAGVIRFAIDDTNQRLYVCTGLFQFNIRTGGSVYQLDSTETTWESLSGPSDTTGLAWLDNHLWVGTYAGEIWRLTSDGELQQQNDSNHLLPGHITELTTTSSNDLFVGMGGYGVYRSTDQGATFTAANVGLKSMALRDVLVNPNDGEELYTLTWDRFGLYYSKNGGKSYLLLGQDYYYTTAAVDPQNFHQLYLGGPNAFYSATIKNKRGAVTSLSAPGPDMGVITALAVQPEHNQVILAGVSAALESTEGYGLYRSTDGGKHWKIVQGFPHTGVHSIVFNPKRPNVVYAAAFGRGVYKSSNGGKSFLKIGDSRLKYAYRLAIYPDNPDILVAGSHLFFAGMSTAEQLTSTYGGIFKTTNAGKGWTALTDDVRTYSDGGTVPAADFELWQYNFGHLPNYEQLLFDPADHHTLIVGHHGENIVMTTDNGASWTKPVSGMIPGDMHNYAYCVGASASMKKIYACSCGRGLFKGTYSRSAEILTWDDATANDNPKIISPTITSAHEARAALLREDAVHDHTPLGLGL